MVSFEGFQNYALLNVPELEEMNIESPSWGVYYSLSLCIATPLQNVLASCEGQYERLVYNMALSFMLSFGSDTVLADLRSETSSGDFRYLTSTSNDSASSSYQLPDALTDLGYVRTVLNMTSFGMQANMILSMLSHIPIYIGG